MNDNIIISHKKVFLSYIAHNERPLTFGYISLQKYFFNIQWHKKKTFKHIYFQTVDRFNIKTFIHRKKNFINSQMVLLSLKSILIA